MFIDNKLNCLMIVTTLLNKKRDENILTYFKIMFISNLKSLNNFFLLCFIFYEIFTSYIVFESSILQINCYL